MNLVSSIKSLNGLLSHNFICKAVIIEALLVTQLNLQHLPTCLFIKPTPLSVTTLCTGNWDHKFQAIKSLNWKLFSQAIIYLWLFCVIMPCFLSFNYFKISNVKATFIFILPPPYRHIHWRNLWTNNGLMFPKPLSGLFPLNHRGIFQFPEYLTSDYPTFAHHPQFMQTILNFIYSMLFHFLEQC